MMRACTIFAAVAAAGVGCNEERTTNAPAIVSAPTATAAPSVDAGPAAAGASAPGQEKPADAGAEAASRKCAATPWASYGHDPARTSASDGCIEGPLTVRWRVTRPGTCGYKFRPGRFVGAVVDEKAVFAAVDCGSSPAVMRVSTEGELLWTFSRGDWGRQTWPALAGDAVLSTDDGVFLIDRETGKFRGRELDVWGEPAVVGDTFYVDNTLQLDSAGPFVGAIDASLKWKWRASVVSLGKGKGVQRLGGVAYADGVVVHAAPVGPKYVPSLAGHDASSGEKRWITKDVWPESAPSIAGGRVFVLERWHGEKSDRLVARSLADGTVVWSQESIWARGPAPVVTDKLVIVHGADGVRAHDRATGALVWSNPSPRKAPYAENVTTMAAAMGSRTLVVTSGPRVMVLSLADGSEKWSGAVATGWSDTEPGGRTVERPIIVGRTVYATSDGALLRLDGK